MKKVNSDYISELQEEFNNYCFRRIETVNGMYITNEINRSLDNDRKIFTETHVKRLFRSYSSPFVPRDVKNKLLYFSHKENEDVKNAYKCNKVQSLQPTEKYAVQNIGHATLLIQIPGFNILTDPVFKDLNWFLYPEKTKSHPSIEELPMIDVIVISHNHRDHVDTASLGKLLEKCKENGWKKPQVFVPKGDRKLLETCGFRDVEEVEWYTKISVRKNENDSQKNVNFISIPADHRSGYNLYDHHRSLVTGWIIHSEQDSVVFKYSGDTRALSDENQKAVDAVLWYEIKNKVENKVKSDNNNIVIPDIICLEPSGPNYTRCYMDVTHQSASYSTLLKFVEADNLAKLTGQDSIEFLAKLKTFMMHHNKFELGPDRFNEGLFVFKKLCLYLDLTEEELTGELVKQKNKIELNLDRRMLKNKLPFTSRPSIAILPEYTSLLVHAKDFIIQEIKSMTDKDMSKETIKEYLLKNTVFPKIGERLSDKDMANSRVDLESIPKYLRKKVRNADIA